MPKAVYFMTLLVVMSFLLTILYAVLPDMIGVVRDWTNGCGTDADK